jgi:molybdate transport system ATP-binding protein
MAEFLKLEQVSVSLGGQKVLKNINFTIHEQEQWAFTGPSGSGKTVLAHSLAGLHFYSGQITPSFGTAETFHRQIFVVEQQHRFTDLTNRQDFYYQQRFNSYDSEQTLTVEEELNRYKPGSFSKADMDKLIRSLHVDQLLSEPLIQLSNGENKRLQLAKALMQQPTLLILDNPFTGLDTEGRSILHSILDDLSAKGMQLIVITSPHEIPTCITHIAELNQGMLTRVTPAKQYVAPEVATPAPFTMEQLKKITHSADNSFEMAVRMVDVNVQYGDKKILQHINWEVKNGEKWSVSGPNGAGKSTLLSLITADNPQAYANEIYLFDRRRGSGESIWDIKKKIGFVSPELHLYFDYSSTCFQAIASGLFDTIGLFRQLNEEQEELVLQWMDLFQIRNRQHTLLANLSAGEQRLVLLARALVKNPPLLILDEPCQGLDDEQRASFKKMFEMLGAHFRTTMIYVSHYREEIPDIVSKHLRLDAGEVS